MFRKLAIATVAAVVLTGLVAAPSVASPPPPSGDDRLAVYSGTVDAEGFAAIVELGVDRAEIVSAPSADGSGRVDVQVILSGGQVEALAAQGTELQLQADPSVQRRTMQKTEGVFRMYSGDGGILEELMAQAAEHPEIAEFRVIGQTVQGQDIGAVRVTKNVNKAKDGKKPTTVYVAAQHAREWITPEMVRRLLDLYLTEYGTDDRITDLVDDTELWFVPVANPDGYDFTFQEGQRLWRKNLRDNDGNGEITVGDGVDLNRNSATRWGYDNEGSSPNPASETYRGPSPASEPETQALDELFGDITPQFMINYHSAAELLLYGIGWQVATPSPDDVIYEAMVGDDENPAVPDYDPDISAELYVTNGDLDSHMQEAHGTLGFTPEMSTCEAAVASVPDDDWDRRGLPVPGLRLPGRREPDPGGVREEHPIRARRRRVGARPGRPGLCRRPRCRGLPRRLVQRVVRRPADRRSVGEAGAHGKEDGLLDQRRQAREDRRHGVGRRRALRLRERRLLRRVPRGGDRRESGRQRRGVVHGHDHRQGPAEGPEGRSGRERALHL